MASPGQVANDLVAQSALYDRTGNERLVLSLRRGATTIRELAARIKELEDQVAAGASGMADPKNFPCQS